jgi:hypothetical protein
MAKIAELSAEFHTSFSIDAERFIEAVRLAKEAIEQVSSDAKRQQLDKRFKRTLKKACRSITPNVEFKGIKANVRNDQESV